MTKSQHRRGDPYEVGFARPPQETRFKKGRSGNPRGRPPKKPDLYAELMKVLDGKVTVTADGVPQRVTIRRALLLRLREEGMRGETWAEKLAQRLVEAMAEQPANEGVTREHMERLKLVSLMKIGVVDENGDWIERTTEADDESE